MSTKKGRDLVDGDYIYGRRIARIDRYTIPACVLHDFYAKKYPAGMPGALVTYAGGGGVTVFLDDEYPEESVS